MLLNPNLLKAPLYLAGRPIEEVQAQYGLTDVVKLASNENPLGPSPKAVEAIRQALAGLHRYPGIQEVHLRRELARRLGLPLDEHNIVTTNGVSDLLRMLSLVCLWDGSEAVICQPTFPLYHVFAQVHGGRPVFVPHKDWGQDLKGMLAQITPRTRLVYVCNPNNPTGTIVTRQQVADLMARVPDWVMVVFDESYHAFVDAPDYPDTVEYVRQGRNVLVARSFSKIQGLAGLRIGYGIAPRHITDYLERARIPFEVNSLGLVGAMASLDDAEYVERSRRLVIEERAYLYDILDHLGLSYVPSQANFILLKGLPVDHLALVEGLTRRGVIVRAMDAFGAPGCIRVSVGIHRENERFAQALRQSLEELLKLDNHAR